MPESSRFVSIIKKAGEAGSLSKEDNQYVNDTLKNASAETLESYAIELDAAGYRPAAAHVREEYRKRIPDAVRFKIPPRVESKEEMPWYAKAALWTFLAWGTFKIIVDPTINKYSNKGD